MSDITPDTHFLESIRADRGTYWMLLAEGVDNAFDAGATEVRLILNKDMISLRDNGIGITRDRELSIARLGEHRSMPTTALGVFGIGLKYQAVSAGDILEVDTTSVDGRMTLHADWRSVVKSGEWKIKDPKWIRALHPITGTHIKIRSLRWPAPKDKDIKTSRDKLAQWFYPALATQRKIILNDETLPILKEPEMRDIVEGNVRLPNGKGAHVRAGMMVDPASSSLYQVQVSYKHRVVMAQSIFGCEQYTGLRRMFARVDLIGPWTLGRFKDRIEDNDSEELYEAVTEIMRPVLEQCHSAQMSVQVNEMTELLNEMLPPEMVPARPPSKKEDGKGGSKSTHRNHGKTNEGEETPKGPARKKQHRGLIIEFDEPQVEEYGYGHFIPGKPGRIVLARDNPHVMKLLEIRDKYLGAQSLYAIALSLYEHERSPVPIQGSFSFADDAPFGLRVWQMNKKQQVKDESEEVA
jgi:Histidine kinase-, DNA gyrase B-, and HSP90-like ATPase